MVALRSGVAAGRSRIIGNRSAGFTWDLGGHVLFSHYKYFDDVMDRALGDAWVEHVREAWVWMRDRWIPYPFQNNIWRLPDAELEACVDGLKALQNVDAPRRLRRFASGCCDRSARASATPSCFPITAKCGPTIRRP